MAVHFGVWVKFLFTSWAGTCPKQAESTEKLAAEILVSTKWVVTAVSYTDFLKKCNFTVTGWFWPTFPKNSWINWLDWTKFERRVEISDIGVLQVLCASQAGNRSWWCFHWGEVRCSLEHSHGSTTLGGRLNSGSQGAESGQSGLKEGNDCLLTQKTLEECAILLSFKRLHGMQFMTQIWITENFFMACQG